MYTLTNYSRARDDNFARWIIAAYVLVLANDSNYIKNFYFPSYFFNLSQVFPHSL